MKPNTPAPAPASSAPAPAVSLSASVSTAPAPAVAPPSTDKASKKPRRPTSRWKRLSVVGVNLVFVALGLVIAWLIFRFGELGVSYLRKDLNSTPSVQQPVIVATPPDSSDKVAALVVAAVAESEARIIRETKEVIAQTRLVPPTQPVEAMLTQTPTPIAPQSETMPVVPEPDIRPSPVRLVIVEGESQKFYLPHDVRSRQWCYKLVEQGKISLSRKAGVKAVVGMPRRASLIGSVFFGKEEPVEIDIPIDHERIVLPKGAKWVKFYWTREGAGGNTDPLTVEVRE